MTPRGVVQHVVESIGPASRAHAEGARANAASAGAPLLERLAARLGGAQHTARPRAARRTIVVVAGDHPAADPGISLGEHHPTIVAARAIADGSAALAHVARAANAPIVLVDAGVAEPAHLPASAIAIGLTRGAPRTVVDVVLDLEAGIALAMSLGEADVLAVGAIGLGAELTSAALLGAATGRAPVALGDADAEAAGRRGVELAGASPIERLAEIGGPETSVLAGAILAAASVNVAIVLDDHATGAAALAAAALAPAVAGYLLAAHRGRFTQAAILAHLGLEPLFDVGLGHGEGTGAAMTLPLLDQVAALCAK
jgi:nicotinate-nucleotide--dimethylbenzimidazole phosphoribosyltransferase